VKFTLTDGRQTQPSGQICPMRIDAVDKIDLPWPVPVFQLFFPRNGTDHIAKYFEMNQPVHTIFGSKSIGVFVSMLIHTLHQIGRDADINRAVMAARQHIDAGLLFFSRRSSDALKWTLKQVQGDGLFYNLRNHHTPRHPELVSGYIYPHCLTLVVLDTSIA
jgi:hypothetical protein